MTYVLHLSGRGIKPGSLLFVPETGVEPACREALRSKRSVYTNSTTQASIFPTFGKCVPYFTFCYASLFLAANVLFSGSLHRRQNFGSPSLLVVTSLADARRAVKPGFYFAPRTR